MKMQSITGQKRQFCETFGNNEKLAPLGRVLPWCQNRMIPKELLRKKVTEIYAFLEGGE